MTEPSTAGRLQLWAQSASRDDLISELIRMDAALHPPVARSFLARFRRPPRNCANCGTRLGRHPHGGQWCSSLCEFDQS